LDLDLLRRYTTEDHAAVEESMPLMATNLTLTEYVATLQSIHPVVALWEETAPPSGADWMRSLLMARKRHAMLKRDLDWFKITRLETLKSTSFPFASQAHWLGAMYVMEGSTLGGQLIARHVE
jgi:heme oxygenase (biliverdin-IX-beta and delta-forming)